MSDLKVWYAPMRDFKGRAILPRKGRLVWDRQSGRRAEKVVRPTSGSSRGGGRRERHVGRRAEEGMRTAIGSSQD